MTLLDNVKRIICGIFVLSEAVMTKIILFADNFRGASSNILTSNSAVNHVVFTKRFNDYICNLMPIKWKHYLALG